MKLIRNNVFETNSSSTHSLVLVDENKLPKRHYKKNWSGKVMSVNYDEPNFNIVCGEFCGRTEDVKMKVPTYKGESLSDPEINASYIFTWLQVRYFNTSIKEEDNYENLTRINGLLARFHEILLDLDLTPRYTMPAIKYNPFDYNYGKSSEDLYDDVIVTPYWELQDVYMEYNDGGFIESYEDLDKILESKETLKDFLTKYTIDMVYEG